MRTAKILEAVHASPPPTLAATFKTVLAATPIDKVSEVVSQALATEPKLQTQLLELVDPTDKSEKLIEQYGVSRIAGLIPSIESPDSWVTLMNTLARREFVWTGIAEGITTNSQTIAMLKQLPTEQLGACLTAATPEVSRKVGKILGGTNALFDKIRSVDPFVGGLAIRTEETETVCSVTLLVVSDQHQDDLQERSRNPQTLA